MDAETRQGVEVDGQGGDEGLSFACCHLGDPALVQHDAADELDVEMAHSQGAPGRFAGNGEGLGQERVELFAAGEPFPEMRGHGLKLIVAQGFHSVFKLVRPVDDGLNALELALVLRADELLDQVSDHGLMYLR